MNDTQKGSWFMLAMALFGLAVTVYMAVSVSVTKQLPENNWIFPLFCVLFIVVPFFVIRKKQSPKEVSKDERDIIVMRNAATISFFSVWALLLIAGLVSVHIFRNEGLMPIFWLPFAIAGIIFISFVIYTVAILVQYRKG
jgi:uncharacterized membrane protein